MQFIILLIYFWITKVEKKKKGVIITIQEIITLIKMKEVPKQKNRFKKLNNTLIIQNLMH